MKQSGITEHQQNFCLAQTIEQEIIQCIFLPPIDHKKNPPQMWEKECISFPQLSLISKGYLPNSCTSVESEPVFLSRKYTK